MIPHSHVKKEEDLPILKKEGDLCNPFSFWTNLFLINKKVKKEGDLRIFFARTCRTSHFKAILSPSDASLVLRGRFPFTSNFPLLLTLLSNERMHNLFDFTVTVPPKFVSGSLSAGEEIDALWNDADPSNTGCSTVPLTYGWRSQCKEISFLWHQ